MTPGGGGNGSDDKLSSAAARQSGERAVPASKAEGGQRWSKRSSPSRLHVPVEKWER